jgi:hypothetical protein
MTEEKLQTDPTDNDCQQTRGFVEIFAQECWQCLSAENDTDWLSPALKIANGSDNERWKLDPLPSGVNIASRVNGGCLAAQCDGEGNASLLNRLLDPSQVFHSGGGEVSVNWFVSTDY